MTASLSLLALTVWDKVFPGVPVVLAASGDQIFGLIQQRTCEWRRGFAEAARDAVPTSWENNPQYSTPAKKHAYVRDAVPHLGSAPSAPAKDIFADFNSKRKSDMYLQSLELASLHATGHIMAHMLAAGTSGAAEEGTDQEVSPPRHGLQGRAICFDADSFGELGNNGGGSDCSRGEGGPKSVGARISAEKDENSSKRCTESGRLEMKGADSGEEGSNYGLSGMKNSPSGGNNGADSNDNRDSSRDSSDYSGSDAGDSSDSSGDGLEDGYSKYYLPLPSLTVVEIHYLEMFSVQIERRAATFCVTGLICKYSLVYWPDCYYLLAVLWTADKCSKYSVPTELLHTFSTVDKGHDCSRELGLMYFPSL
ncbi:hypothetical protein FA95DRAFT_1575737 [Auriscalpium vulgare]|uniref:Uncharacterized protein n=1 Tax=Auriscalpium vulgare TaxID=40419 RepID=A0ACB8REF3_9AGAM|nr:hypothetical protein FA95DRAFT_1575737 [Auriscalpium vulgare]